MNKKLKAMLSCLALTATIGAISACDFGNTSEEVSSSPVTSESASSVEQESTELGKNELTATFVADGVTVKTIIYKKGATSILAPTVPAKEGYTGAWEAYELGENITVNAVYTAIEYTVTFTADDVTIGTATYTVENKEITVPEVPAKVGYTGVWEAYELTTGDVTVKAVYTINTYNVTFMADGVAVGDVQTYTVENKDITVPAVPEKAGYTGVWAEYELTTGDVTVEAVYTLINYVVNFKADGKLVGTTQTYNVENKDITEPTAPAKDHYTVAWEAYELTTGDVTVNAIYTAIEYKVTFMADGKVVAEVPYTIENSAIAEPNVPEKTGYGGTWGEYTLDGGNKTVEAIYKAGKFNVTFKADGMTVAVKEYTTDNTNITEPEVPAKEHYTGAWETYTLTTGDVTVNAVYTAIDYTVKFVVDGEDYAVFTYNMDKPTITEPTVPAKAHYTAAWSSYELTGGNVDVKAVYTAIEYSVTFKADGEVVDYITYTVENKDITAPAVPDWTGYTGVWETYELKGGDVEVNAIYTAIEYTVTFMAKGETVAEIEYTVATAKDVVAPAVPAKDHYKDGKWEDYTLTTGNVTVNAIYTAIEYKVTFMADGEVLGEATYTMDNKDVSSVAIPEKVGYSGSWGDYDLPGGDVTVNLEYTPNNYTINYNANGGEMSEYEQIVTYDAAYTLFTATAPASWQSFVGWADANGNMFASEGTWNIAEDIILTAVYSESITFDGMTEVPSYMKAVDTTEYLAITELNGNKVLQIKSKADGNAPAMKVTVDFLASFFDDSSVDYIAFEAKSGTTTINNFRRETNRSGALTAVTYEEDLTFKHPVDEKTYATTGIRADAWKTFYFSRADYNFWVSQGVTEAKFIASGQFNKGDSIYLDNIRPVTAAERKASIYDFENGGVRVNDAGGKTLLFYTLDQGGTWQFNFQVGTGGFTNVGYTNENVSSSNTAFTFTKEAGNWSINLPSGKAFYNEIVTKTGCWAVDVYVPVDSDAKLAYHVTTYPGAALVKGAWNTIYVADSKNQLTISDTTGGTYIVDNFRSLTLDEYTIGGLSMEVNAGGLRTSNLGDDTAHSGVAYYYAGKDHAKNLFSFAIAEGNSANDADVLNNVRLTDEQSHSGGYSLAFDKAAGYMYITMRDDSAAYELLKDGFTFWIYSTTSINGTSANNFINGCNAKFNGGEGMNVPANTWTKVTVTAADMSPTRFLIIQGSVEGTIYIDDFQPLK